MNPLSVRYKGDRTIGEQFLGEGKRLLYLLKQKMGIGNLDQDQFMRHYRDANGLEAKIKVQSIFGKDFITIEPTLPLQQKQIIIPKEEIEIKKYVTAYYDYDGSTIGNVYGEPTKANLWVYRNGIINKYTVFDGVNIAGHSSGEQGLMDMDMYGNGTIVCGAVLTTGEEGDIYTTTLKISTNWGKTFSADIPLESNAYSEIAIEIDKVNGDIYVANVPLYSTGGFIVNIYKSKEIHKNDEGIVTSVDWELYDSKTEPSGFNFQSHRLDIYDGNVIYGYDAYKIGTPSTYIANVFYNKSLIKSESNSADVNIFMGCGIAKDIYCYVYRNNPMHYIYKNNSVVRQDTNTGAAIFLGEYYIRGSGNNWIISLDQGGVDFTPWNNNPYNILLSIDGGNTWNFKPISGVGNPTYPASGGYSHGEDFFSCDILDNTIIFCNNYYGYAPGSLIPILEMRKGNIQDGNIAWELIYTETGHSGYLDNHARIVIDKTGSLVITTKEEQKINV